MRLKLAEKTGFCFGVKRAVKMAENALSKNKLPIYSLGSIIHNERVVRDLSKKGLKVIKDINDIKKGVLVISSHGLSPKTKSSIEKRGIGVIDTTCPFVSNAQKIASRLYKAGYKMVIVGDRTHPEVRALVDFAGGKAIVVTDSSQADRLKIGGKDKVSVISQTTQSKANFESVVKAIAAKRPKELKVFSTICNDAGSRQKHARDLSQKVDLMLVVGGRNSANTKRLLDVCSGSKCAAYLVEDESEIDSSWIKPGIAIGVTSGASTPDWIVKKVVKKIQKKIR